MQNNVIRHIFATPFNRMIYFLQKALPINTFFIKFDKFIEKYNKKEITLKINL